MYERRNRTLAVSANAYFLVEKRENFLLPRARIHAFTFFSFSPLADFSNDPYVLVIGLAKTIFETNEPDARS